MVGENETRLRSIGIFLLGCGVFLIGIAMIIGVLRCSHSSASRIDNLGSDRTSGGGSSTIDADQIEEAVKEMERLGVYEKLRERLLDVEVVEEKSEQVR
jgi:hypothetical protein